MLHASLIRVMIQLWTYRTRALSAPPAHGHSHVYSSPARHRELRAMPRRLWGSTTAVDELSRKKRPRHQLGPSLLGSTQTLIAVVVEEADSPRLGVPHQSVPTNRPHSESSSPDSLLVNHSPGRDSCVVAPPPRDQVRCARKRPHRHRSVATLTFTRQRILGNDAAQDEHGCSTEDGT